MGVVSGVFGCVVVLVNVLRAFGVILNTLDFDFGGIFRIFETE